MGVVSKIKSKFQNPSYAVPLSFVSAAVVRGGGAFWLILLNYLVVRYLGAEESGKFFIYLSFCYIASRFMLFGLETFLSKHIGENKYVLPKVFNLFLSINVIFFIVFIFIRNFSFSFISEQPIPYSVYFSSVLFAVVILFSNLLIRLRITKLSILMSTALFQSLFCFLIFLENENNISASLNNLFLSLLLAVLISILLLGTLKSNVVSRSSKLLNRSQINECFSYGTYNLLLVLVNWGAIFVASFSLSSEDVAVLNVSQRLANLISFIMIAANFVVTPRFAKFFFDRNPMGIQELCRNSQRVILPISIFFVVIFTFFSSDILSFFAKSYSEEHQVLLILTFAQLISVLCGFVAVILNMCGHENILRNISLGTTCVTLLGVHLFSDSYGVTGAALGIFIGVSLQNIIASYYVYRKLAVLSFKFW